MDKTKKMINLLRKMSKNGDMTWIACASGEPRTVKKHELDEFLTAVEAMMEQNKEAVFG